MKFTNKQMVEESLVRISHIQEHIKSVDAAVSFLRNRKRHDEFNTGETRGRLFEAELDEWRNLFMWAITLDGEEKERIKAAAYERFLKDGIHVAHWFNNGVSPGSWLSSDETQFRDMARKAFAPKE